jgi:hypothetical protein
MIHGSGMGQSQADSLVALVKSARPEGVGQNISIYA